jgi:hypothetical protein
VSQSRPGAFSAPTGEVSPAAVARWRANAGDPQTSPAVLLLLAEVFPHEVLGNQALPILLLAAPKETEEIVRVAGLFKAICDASGAGDSWTVALPGRLHAMAPALVWASLHSADYQREDDDA